MRIYHNFFSGILEIFFVVLFSIEVLMRIIAHGYQQYLFSKMNVFDLVVNSGFSHFEDKLSFKYRYIVGNNFNGPDF